MTENTIVTNGVFTPAEAIPNATVTPSDNLTGTVAELVGEGKKYKTLEALAASVLFKEEHINKLEAENKAIREAKEKLKAEEVFEKLLESKPENTQTVGLTEEQITQLISNTLTGQEKKKIESTNIQLASDTLTNHFGEANKATLFIQNKATELKLSVDFLMSIAAKNPSAFYSVVGITPNQPVVSNKVITNNVSNTANLNTGLEVGSEAYYANMLKTDKAKYMSPAIQREISQAAASGLYFKQTK